MRQYEITFIVDPVLSGDEIKKTADMYSSLLKDEGCEILHTENLGLKQLAYEINKRNSGIYYSMEFKTETGAVIQKLELSLRRDERIMRFLSVFLDRYAIKYNEDKRNGLIGKKESVIKNGANAKPEKKEPAKPRPIVKIDRSKQGGKSSTPAPVATPAAAAPVVEAAAATEAVAAVSDETKTVVSDNGESKVSETVPVTETKTVKDPVVAETSTADSADLTKIEGVGPKTKALLNEAGINSFQDLASSSESRLKEILTAAGGVYLTMNPSTWGKQSQLAAEGQWDELKTWQDKLDGGIEKSEEE